MTLRKTWEHKDEAELDFFSGLLGEITVTLHDRITLSSWGSIASQATDVGGTAVTNTNILQLRLVLAGKTFIVPIYPWSTLVPQPADQAISTGNRTAMKCYEADGDVDTYILVGRSDRNIPLLQQGAGLNPSGSVPVDLHVCVHDGGPIDRLIESTGQRQLICMQCDQDARPNPPPHGTDLRHNGREPAASALSTGEVWWPSGSRQRSFTTKTWFAFGEAVYDNLQGIWRVDAAWYVVDSADRVNIQFAGNWDGPWGTDDYITGYDRYARLRRADWSYIIRFIGTDGAGHDKRWIPLTEQFVSANDYGYSPYTARCNFELHPDEWDHLRFEWEWESISSDLGGVTYHRKASCIVPASDIVGSVQTARDRRNRTPGSNATSWFMVANQAEGMHAIRQAAFSDSYGGIALAVQFESSSTTDNAPISHIVMLQRGNTHLNTEGTLRTYVK